MSATDSVAPITKPKAKLTGSRIIILVYSIAIVVVVFRSVVVIVNSVLVVSPMILVLAIVVVTTINEGTTGISVWLNLTSQPIPLINSHPSRLKCDIRPLPSAYTNLLFHPT